MFRDFQPLTEGIEALLDHHGKGLAITASLFPQVGEREVQRRVVSEIAGYKKAAGMLVEVADFAEELEKKGAL